MKKNVNKATFQHEGSRFIRNIKVVVMVALIRARPIFVGPLFKIPTFNVSDFLDII